MVDPKRTLMRLFARTHVAVYRATDGRVGGRIFGHPALLLTVVGRRTGRERTTPLMYFEDGDALIVMASANGAAKDPAWWSNLKEERIATAQLGRRTLRFRAEEANGAAQRDLLDRVDGLRAAYASNQRLTARPIPLAVLRPIEEVTDPVAGARG